MSAAAGARDSDAGRIRRCRIDHRKIEGLPAGRGVQSHGIVPQKPGARAEYPGAARADEGALHRGAPGRADALQGQSAGEKGAGVSSGASATFRDLARIPAFETATEVRVSRLRQTGGRGVFGRNQQGVLCAE